MLILSRKEGEKIKVGDNVIIELVEICPDGRIRLGITAPKEVPIYRTELLPLTYSHLPAHHGIKPQEN